MGPVKKANYENECNKKLFINYFYITINNKQLFGNGGL